MITTRFSRKQFLKAAALLLSIYPLKLFYDVSRSGRGKSAAKKQVLPMDFPEGLSFHGEVIAWRRQGETRFFSARCPHLGCRIDRQENNQLVCPCHGSRFSLQGEVLEGPATKNLSALSFVTDVAKRQITISLPN